jgi:hypothetical protein
LNIFSIVTLSIYGTLSQRKCCLTGVGRAVASSTGQLLVRSVWSSTEISRCSCDCDGKGELGRDGVCERFLAYFNGFFRNAFSSQLAACLLLLPLSHLQPATCNLHEGVAGPLLTTLCPGMPCLTQAATVLITMLLFAYDDGPANAHK